MIPALSAQMMSRKGGGVRPGCLPAGAIAHLDFVGGNYFAGGAVRNVGALLGGGFNPADISASGMYVAYGPYSTNRPNAIGLLFNDLVLALGAGCTIIFEIDFGYDAYGRTINFMDAANEGDALEYISGQFRVSKAAIEDQDDVWFWDAVEMNIGRHKFGQTFARRVGGSFEYAVSTDGGAAVTQTVAYPPLPAVHTITLFHDGQDEYYVLDNSHVRSITLYPAVTPAQLAALSA